MAQAAVKLAIVAAVLLATGAAGWRALGFQSWDWHQKLTLSVETPAGIVSGGSVVAVHATTEPKWIPVDGAGGLHSSIKGEASFVEIAPGRYLFALLDGEASRALSLFIPVGIIGNERPAFLEQIREVRDVPREKYPLLVTFTDIADPKTVTKVDPDNLAATFGPGVALKRITLEITDEKVTERRITRLLPCLKSGKACIPLNKNLAFGDPMRNVLNDRFWRKL
ncbi:hypothetical protein ACWTU6_27390 [Mesorhizobium sp. BHbsci]